MYTNIAMSYLQKLSGLKGPRVIVPGVFYSDPLRGTTVRPKELRYEDQLEYGTAIAIDHPYFNAYAMAAIALTHELMEERYPGVEFEVSTPNFILVMIGVEHIDKIEQIRDDLYEHLHSQDLWVLPVAVCTPGCTAGLKTETKRNTDEAMEEVLGFISEQTPLQLAEELQELDLEWKEFVLTKAKSSPYIAKLKVCAREPKQNPMDIAGYWDPVDSFLDLSEEVPSDDRRIAAHYLKGHMYG